MNFAATLAVESKTRSSNDEEQEVWWYCPNGCGHRYRRKWNVRRHLTLQCGVPKQFKCTICHKEFTQKESLKTHMGMQHYVIMS